MGLLGTVLAQSIIGYVALASASSSFLVRNGEKQKPWTFRYYKSEYFYDFPDQIEELKTKFKVGTEVWVVASQAQVKTKVQSIETTSEGNRKILGVALTPNNLENKLRWTDFLILSVDRMAEQDKWQEAPVTGADNQFVKHWVWTPAKAGFQKLPPKTQKLIKIGKATKVYEQWACPWFDPNSESVPPKEVQASKLAASFKQYLLVTATDCEPGEYITKTTSTFAEDSNSSWKLLSGSSEGKLFRDIDGDGLPEFSGCAPVGGTCEPYLFKLMPAYKLLATGFFM